MQIRLTILTPTQNYEWILKLRNTVRAIAFECVNLKRDTR